MPSASSTVGTMSIAWRTASRICALRLDALRPVDDERVADAAAVGLALPAPEGRVAGVGPAPRVVVEVLRPAEVVDRRQVLLERVRHVVEELVLVDRAVRPALGAGAVVGDEHDQRVLVVRRSTSGRRSARRSGGRCGSGSPAKTSIIRA